MNLDQVKWIDFQDVPDDRGRLTAIEAEHIPFPIKRIFYVHQVVAGVDRGGHAHRDTDQVVAGIHGNLKMDVSDGITTKTFDLNHPGKGVFVPRMFWIRLYDFSSGAVCLVLASTKYDRSKSIRTWDDYLNTRKLQWTPAPGAGR